LNKWFLFLAEWRKTNVENNGKYANESVIMQAKLARKEYKPLF
jgi:hypothetical protein